MGTDINYESAADYWESRETSLKRVEPVELINKIENFLESHVTCALATGFGDYIRCTPIEYTYYKKALWLFSEGGKKFLGLGKNKNVSLSVFDNYNGFENLNGMQITATATIINSESSDYKNLAKLKKINLEALKKLSHPMYLIKITPKRIDFLSSDFKKEGYSSRQFIEFVTACPSPTYNVM